MIAVESTVQLNIFNTSIEILQETADVCGLLEGNGLEFVAFEIPSQTVPNSDVDVKNIFNHLLKTDQLNSEERAKIQEALDSLNSRVLSSHNNQSILYEKRDSLSEAAIPSFSPHGIQLEKYSAMSSRSRTSSNGGSTKILDDNITMDSFDSDFVNNSVSNSIFLENLHLGRYSAIPSSSRTASNCSSTKSLERSIFLENAGMSASMAAFINSMDGFFKTQVGPSVGLEQDNPDHSVQDSVVSTMNRMVDQVCQTSGGSSAAVYIIPIAAVLPEQKVPNIQVDHPENIATASLQVVPNDECPLSNVDNQSFVTASEMELSEQDLQSWDFSQPIYDQMNDIRCTTFSSCSDHHSTMSYGEENDKNYDGASNVSHRDFDGGTGGSSFDLDQFSIISSASDRQIVDKVGTNVMLRRKSRRKNRRRLVARQGNIVPCMFPACKSHLTVRETRIGWSRLLRHARSHAKVKISCDYCKIKSSSLDRAQIHHQKKHPRLILRSVPADEISHEEMNLIAEICFPKEFKKMKFPSVSD